MPAADAPALPWWLRPAARRAWAVLCAALLVLITWLALTPAPPPQADTGWDKANHALAFAVLAVLARLAQGPGPRPARTAWTAASLLAYGAAIELLQAQRPPRSGEWSDLLADAAGIVAGLLLAAPLWRRVPDADVRRPSP